MDAASALGLEEAVAPLFEILRSGDEAERIRAVKALAAIDSPSARDALSRALLDPVTEIRVAVLSNARVQAELIAPAASALDDVDASVRALAARALGESGEQSALLSLIGKLGDPSVDVRVAVARALGELGAEESIPALGGALDDPEGHVREAAAISLSKIGGEVARQLLLRFIDRERGPGKRSAIVALAAFEKNAPIERLMREVHHEEFRETLYRAIESLTSDDSLRRRVTDSLLVELERANTQAALVGTVEALSNALDAGPVPELAPRLIDTLESIDAPRSGLIRALGKSGGEEALLALLVELDQLRQRASSQWERRVSSPELFDALRAIRDRGDLDYRAVDPLLDASPTLSPKTRRRPLSSSRLIALPRCEVPSSQISNAVRIRRCAVRASKRFPITTMRTPSSGFTPCSTTAMRGSERPRRMDSGKSASLVAASIHRAFWSPRADRSPSNAETHRCASRKGSARIGASHQTSAHHRFALPDRPRKTATFCLRRDPCAHCFPRCRRDRASLRGAQWP